MTTMITEVYDALLSAGADDGRARRAAEVLADHDSEFATLERRIDKFEANVDARFALMDGRFTGVDGRIAALEAKMDGRFTTIEATLNGKFNLLAWMLGILVAAVSALVLRSFF